MQNCGPVCARACEEACACVSTHAKHVCAFSSNKRIHRYYQVLKEVCDVQSSMKLFHKMKMMEGYFGSQNKFYNNTNSNSGVLLPEYLKTSPCFTANFTLNNGRYTLFTRSFFSSDTICTLSLRSYKAILFEKDLEYLKTGQAASHLLLTSTRILIKEKRTSPQSQELYIMNEHKKVKLTTKLLTFLSIFTLKLKSQDFCIGEKF